MSVTKVYLIVSLMCMAVLSGCGGGSSASSSSSNTSAASAPTASFSISPVNPTAGQDVTFTDASTGSPTSWLWNFGDSGTSTQRNPTHKFSSTGSFSVSLTVRNAAGSNSTSKSITVKSSGGSDPAFNMEQTLSDEAQRTTLAFAGLGMMTGNLEAQSFFPPGKVADYTGFQYLRDNDPDNMGHNTSFLTRIANNVIYVLNDTQMAKLVALATTQQSQIDLYGYKRTR